MFEWVIHHPALNDSITYQESKIIASVEIPDDAGRLDADSPHSIEERTITLPSAGKVELTIIRTDLERGYAGMMDDLEQAVRSHEEFMGLPFPQRQVIYVIAPGAGGNWSNNFVYVGDDYRGGAYYHTISHEAAHYYWTWPVAGWTPHPANLGWVSEGAAELLTYGPEAARDEWAENEWYSPCVGLTIPDLEASTVVFPGGGSPLCWYPVGEAFYRDLYRAMEPTNFRLAFRRWLLHGMFDLPGVCAVDGGISTTYCHVMEAFTTYASEDSRSVVEHVINRWYGGAPLPDASIRGVVTGPDGQPAIDTAVEVYGRWVDPEPDGTFDVVVPSGSYIIEVNVRVGSEWFFIGWYDGIGGITTDLSQAFEVTVESAGVEGIEIVVPADRASLLCPPGSWRSSRDGQCV